MTPLAVTWTDIVLVAPWAFLLGIVSGLAGASRWRIVRRENGA